MAQGNFGLILRDARERKGYDIASVARRLRIRPDILEAIEESDFARMPPRGYTRNMVNAYARLLGLNPTEITHRYLDECYAYQVGKARSSARPSGIDMSSAPGERRASSLKRKQEESEVPRSGLYERPLYTDRRSAERSEQDASYGADRVNTGHLYAEDRAHRAKKGALPNTQYTNFYSGPNKPSQGNRSKLPFIIGGAVILVLLIIVLVLVFGPKDDNSTETEPNVPVTGITTDTDQPSTTESDTGENTDNAAEQQTAVAPTSFKFTYKVADGKEAWIEIWNDGELVIAEMVQGGVSKDLTCKDTLTFNTADVSAVKVYQDDEELTLKPDSDGVVNLTIKFSDVLAAWNKENGVTADSGKDGATSS